MQQFVATGCVVQVPPEFTCCGFSLVSLLLLDQQEEEHFAAFCLPPTCCAPPTNSISRVWPDAGLAEVVDTL